MRNFLAFIFAITISTAGLFMLSLTYSDNVAIARSDDQREDLGKLMAQQQNPDAVTDDIDALEAELASLEAEDEPAVEEEENFWETGVGASIDRQETIRKMTDEGLWHIYNKKIDPNSLKVESRLLIKDFNGTYLKEMKHFYPIETWKDNPSDDTQVCRVGLDQNDFRPVGVGRSLQVRYDVESRNPASNGFWILLKGLDVSESRYLSFWVKGNEHIGFSDSFGLGLVDANGETIVLKVEQISTDWQNILVDLNDFKKEKFDWSRLIKIDFILKSSFVTQPKGIFNLDQIEFLKIR